MFIRHDNLIVNSLTIILFLAFPIACRDSVSDQLWGVGADRIRETLAQLLGRFMSPTQRCHLQWVMDMWEGPWAGNQSSDPYGRLLQWLQADPSRIDFYHQVPNEVSFYQPFSAVPSPTTTHTLAVTALAGTSFAPSLPSRPG